MVTTGEPERAKTNSQQRSRRIIKWGSGALIAFLAFAPPGTMIVIVLLVSRAVGLSWIVVGTLALLAAGITLLLILRRRRAVD